MRIVALSLVTIVLFVVLGACNNKTSENDSVIDSVQYKLPDTLRVATLYSPTSYFIYRDAELGYDYSLVSQFCKDKSVAFHLVIAPNMSRMIEMLDSGKVDLIAYEIPKTSEYKSRVRHCGVVNYTTQVLVQPLINKKPSITDVTQLVGKDVYVEKDSKYHQRIENLNDELGGGINVHIVDKDTLITEDLIRMVSNGEIPLTIVDSDIASLNKTYYKDLDVSLQLSFSQQSSWAVSSKAAPLAKIIDEWFAQEAPSAKYTELHKRYFELSKNERRVYTIDFSKGYISNYDAYFKKYAAQTDWDWRLMAAQAYVESRFDSTAVSWAGARGIMQLMPSTAQGYGLTSRIAYIDDNIRVASLLLQKLNNLLKKHVEDPQERMKFVIAAYNSGLAHIYDAIALAEKYGMDPKIWDGNVANAVLMKSKPEYYNDPVCKYGYFRGYQTFEYVNSVMDFYRKTLQYIPK